MFDKHIRNIVNVLAEGGHITYNGSQYELIGKHGGFITTITPPVFNQIRNCLRRDSEILEKAAGNRGRKPPKPKLPCAVNPAKRQQSVDRIRRAEIGKRKSRILRPSVPDRGGAVITYTIIPELRK